MTLRSPAHTSHDQEIPTYRFFMLLPTIIIGCHGNACIANASLLSKHHLWNRGHIDNICTPSTEYKTFCPRAETRPLNCDYCPLWMASKTKLLSCFYEDLQKGRPSLKSHKPTCSTRFCLSMMSSKVSRADLYYKALRGRLAPSKTGSGYVLTYPCCPGPLHS